LEIVVKKITKIVADAEALLGALLCRLHKKIDLLVGGKLNMVERLVV